jgi:site-specific DNA-cytosine methylase
VSHTLDGTQGQAVAYGISNQPTPKIGEDICPSLDAKKNGGGRMECVCYENHGQDSRVRDCGDIAPTISKHAGTGGNNLPLVMAFTERGRKEGRTVEAQEDIAYALTNPSGGGRTDSRQIVAGMSVRRLSPRETERLQGFQFRCSPDYPGAWVDELGRWWSPDWTDVDAEGKSISDSARYRMMGNAVTVNVVRWIGERIKRLQEKGR